MVTITDQAVAKIKALQSENVDATTRLRVFVSQGGCSGMEYGMKFDAPSGNDHRVEKDDCEIIIDPESMELIQGSVLDFDDGLQGKGFEVKNPNAKETCGCGKSFN